MYKILAKTLILGKRVVYLPSCHSTNDMARDLTKRAGFIEGTIVITDDQTAGRGQMGNLWESAAQKNLTFSLLLKPSFIPVNKQFQLTMAVALGVVEFLDKQGVGFQIKWPNDIYFKNEKIAGILIQNSIGGAKLENAIVGIGLNVNQLSFDNSMATSLQLILKTHFDLNLALEDLCFSIEKRYLQLKAKETSTIKKDYLSRLLGYGSQRIYNDGHDFDGRIIDVTDTGQLVLECVDGIRNYDFKQIKFIF